MKRRGKDWVGVLALISSVLAESGVLEADFFVLMSSVLFTVAKYAAAWYR
jgi:predicted amino acid-binding ACT domain protein